MDISTASDISGCFVDAERERDRVLDVFEFDADCERLSLRDDRCFLCRELFAFRFAFKFSDASNEALFNSAESLASGKVMSRESVWLGTKRAVLSRVSWCKGRRFLIGG